MALTLEEINNNLRSQVLLNFPTADTEAGSVIRDLMIDPQSVQIYNLSQEIDDVENLNTFVANAELIPAEKLNQLGATYNVTRNNGNIAKGIITFRATSLPEESIRIGNEDGTGGITVGTLTTDSGDSYEFTTTETVYLTPSTQFVEEHGFYEVSAPITASGPGSNSNVGIGTITVLRNSIANITSVYNYIPTSGGTDQQSNTEYALSIQSAILGGSKNIEDGINNILLGIEGVSEVKTLHPNSEEEPTETGFAISYIKGFEEQVVDNYIIDYVSTKSKYVLPKSPATRIISVIATVNGEQKTLRNGIDYSLTNQSLGIYDNTIYDKSSIEFLGTATGTPDDDSEVYVTYAYNYLIEECQNKLNEEMSNYLILGNILVAQASPVIIDFSTSIKLKYNYNTENVKNEILSGISLYINSLSLGQDLTQEDIYTYLSTTFSNYISAITYPFYTFCFDGEEASKTELIFTYGQYASVDANSINITFE